MAAVRASSIQSLAHRETFVPGKNVNILWTNIRIIAGYSLQEPKLNDDIRYQKQQVRQRELEKDLHPAKFQPESIHNRPNRPR